MQINNKFSMNVMAKSANEGFARACISAFAAQLDPTLEEINDINALFEMFVLDLIIKYKH